MSLLKLRACPICYEKDSLVRQELDRAGIPFTWYQCRECRSVLLWLGRDHWAYQKIGREDKAYLLKQPLTGDMLQALLDLEDQEFETPVPAELAIPDVELDVDPELAAMAVPAVLAEGLDVDPDLLPLEEHVVPVEAEDAAPEPPEALPEKERRGVSRWLVLALAMVGLCSICLVAGLLVGLPAIDNTMATVVAGVEGTLAPQDTPLPSEAPPANTATATDTIAPSTNTPLPPTDTPRPAASVTPSPTATALPPTATPLPTDTPLPAATATPVATDTPLPTATPMPSATPPPPTATPLPTDTPLPVATSTPVPTATALPPTTQPTPTPSAMLGITSVNRTTGWVDIKNAGGAAQYLVGWALVWEEVNRRCALWGALQSRQTIRVWAEAKDIGQGGFNCGFDAPAWTDGSEPVVLYDVYGQEVDRK